MLKKIISYILTLILIILLVLSIALTIANNTILKKNFAIKVLERKDYYHEVYSIIKDNFINNTIQSGLEESVLENIITEEEVKNDVNSLVSYIYGQGELNIDKNIVRDRLKQNIDQVIKENNKKVTKDEQESIDLYLDTIADLYQNGITYSKDYVEKIKDVLIKIQSIIQKVIYIAYGITAFFVIILLVINRSLVLKYLSISMMGAGALCIIPKLIEVASLQIHNILLLNLAFSKIIIGLIEGVLGSFLVVGIVTLILGFVINIVASKVQVSLDENQ